MKPRVIPGAVKAAMIDHIKGLKPSPSRHDAVEGSAWADEYRLTYDRLTKNNSQHKVNSTEGVSHFLSFHPGLTVRLGGKELTASQAQATLALSKYANSSFDISLTGDMIVLTEKE